MQKDRIIDHIERLLYVARNTACFRALLKYKDELNQDYWIMIYNNFFDIAILGWCKVFGGDIEPTHWKRIVDDHSHFRQNLLTALKVDQSDWETYWKDIKDYRDKFIAHHIIDPNITHFPSLDIALKSSFYYYSWLVNKLELFNIYYVPDDLKDYYDDYLIQISRFAEISYLSTQNI
jgi:hypothetical protein